MPSKGRVHGGCAADAGREGRAEACEIEQFDGAAHERVSAQTGNLDHRRGQHDAFEWRGAVARLRQEDGGAHGMGEREPRTRAEELQYLPVQGVEVALEHREIVDVALCRVGEFAGR